MAIDSFLVMESLQFGFIINASCPIYCLVIAPPGRTYVEIKDLSPGLQQGPSEETYKIISVSNSALQPINRVVDLVVKIIGEKFELWKDSADTKMALIQKDFGNVAAGISALKGVQGALYSLAANSDATAARMMDTDFAKSSANLAKFTVLNQSAMAMVAQANQANSSILAVLQ